MQLAYALGMADPKKKTKDAESFWKRLQQASEYAGVSCLPSDIAKELAVAPSAVTKYIDGGFPKTKNLNKLAIKRKVRSEWLQSGQGPMISEKDLDPETQELLRLWRTLPDDAKQRLLVNVRYEATASEAITTGKREILTSELIRLLQVRDRN